MTLKHKSEWPILVDIARKYFLDNEQTVILLAFREVIDGIMGCEFNKMNALERSLESQAAIMAREIKEKEFTYQAYIKRLPPESYVKDFIEYIGGNEAYRLKKYVDLITKEFDPVAN